MLPASAREGSEVATKKKVDLQTTNWDEVRRTYETGRYSLAALAKLCDVPTSTLYRKAKEEKWHVGIASAMVAARTTEKLLAGKGPLVSEQDIELAAATNVHIIREHRGISARGRDLSYKLIGELEERIANRPTIADLIDAVDKASDGGTKVAEAIARLNDKLGTDKIANTLKDIATATKVWIDIERSAFNLDKDHGDPIDTLTEEQLNARITDLLRKARTREAAGGGDDEGEQA